MVSGIEFVILDLFWDIEKNGGRIPEVDPSITGYYWWKCYGCGESYQETLQGFMQSFKREKVYQLNNYCTSCIWGNVEKRYSVYDAIDYLEDNYKGIFKVILNDFLNKSSSSFTYYTFCPDCGKLHCANMNTFKSRGSLRCKDCITEIKELSRYGSLADALPEILPYYSDKNIKPASKYPMCRKNSKDSKVYLICPQCGINHEKRLDAVINNGAYCGPCANSSNHVKRTGISLFDSNPRVAFMFDNGGNIISSKDVPPNSHREYSFMCDCKGVPHIFKKKLSAMVKADNRGEQGCPVCMGYEVQKGINDFESWNPDIARYWDYKNNDLKPDEVYYRSPKKYSFRCEHGHTFEKDLIHMMRSKGTKNLGCPVCYGRQVVSGANDLATLRPDILEWWDYNLNSLNPEEVTVGSNKEAWFKCANDKCGKPYLTQIYNRSSGSVCFCEECRNTRWSYAEKSLVGLIKSWGIEVEEEVNLFGNRQSYDIYIPSKSIAIEYNGLYWHSERVRPDKYYHYNKYIECKYNGIDLYYIWEDDYKDKKELIIRMLKNRLGVGTEKKVDARNCVVYEAEYSDIKDFLDENHIQGSTSGSFYLVLVEKDTKDIVAVGVFLDQGNTVLLKRYCTNCNVRGGFSKLLATIEKVYSYSSIVTFSDNGISSGNLYENLGFVKVSDIKPDYSYLVNNKRIHKFNYRLNRFEKDRNLYYDENFSERELADINGLVRVWDAGKIKWCKEFNK